MIDHNHFICHFIFGGHLLNIPSYSFKVTKKSQNKAEVPFPPHSGIPLITLITYIDV